MGNKNTDTGEKYIFVSYSHKDSGPVLSLVRQLEMNGYRVWYDEGIVPGIDWDENIAKRIERCSFFIAYLTAGYMSSDNCLDELNYARDLDCGMLLIYGENVELPSGMKMRLNRKQAVYRNKYPYEPAFYNKIFSAHGIEVCKNI